MLGIDTSARHLELLDDDECLALLATHPVGRIGLSAAALPVVLPVNFALAGRSILIRTDAGVKLDAARRGDVACLEVDDHEVLSHTGYSVLATGRLRVVTDAARRRDLDDVPLSAWAAPAASHLVELRIELLSGRRITTGRGAEPRR